MASMNVNEKCSICKKNRAVVTVPLAPGQVVYWCGPCIGRIARKAG